MLVAPGADEIGAPVGAETPLALPSDVPQKDAWGALISGVGMLGLVVRVEIEVEDAFYLWVRVQRHQHDDALQHIGELASSMAIRPSIAPGDDRIAPRCEFFQILWYPNVGKLFTMCGVKVKRELVGSDLVEMLGRGKLGKDRYVMADVLANDAQNKQYLDQLYLQGDPDDTTQNPYALDVSKARPGASWRNVLDLDNTVLNPSFDGVLRSFAKWGHRFLNYAWPFAKDDPDLLKRCAFVEGQRWQGAIFTQKGGKGLNDDDFTVLGPSHRLISSQIADQGKDVTQLDYEIAIPEANWDHSLAALKKRITDESLCLPMTGVFIRFSQVDDRTLIAHAAEGGKLYQKGARIMFLDFVVYAPIVQEVMNSAVYERERKYHEAYRQAAEHLIRSFAGRPHWGKNANWWPLNQREWCGKSLFHLHRECSTDGRCDREYAARLQRFQKVIDVFDPHGRFENEFALDAGLVRSARAAEGDEQSARCP